MQCDTLLQQVWWLDGNGVCLHPIDQRINLTNGVFVVNNGKLTKYFPM